MDNHHLIRVVSDHYSAQTTLGKLFVTPEGGVKDYFCEVLEDTLRPPGIKVYGDTAIPRNILLNVGIRFSPAFGRDMLVLYTHRDGDRYYIRHGGIEFGEVMFHGGNRHGDSKGCPLVAYNRVNDDTIQGTAEADLFDRVKELMETCDVKAIFESLPQAG